MDMTLKSEGSLRAKAYKNASPSNFSNTLHSPSARSTHLILLPRPEIHLRLGDICKALAKFWRQPTSSSTLTPEKIGRWPKSSPDYTEQPIVEQFLGFWAFQLCPRHNYHNAIFWKVVLKRDKAWKPTLRHNIPSKLYWFKRWGNAYYFSSKWRRRER